MWLTSVGIGRMPFEITTGCDKSADELPWQRLAQRKPEKKRPQAVSET
jgi:hypothetical protein